VLGHCLLVFALIEEPGPRGRRVCYGFLGGKSLKIQSISEEIPVCLAAFKSKQRVKDVAIETEGRKRIKSASISNLR